MPQRETRSARSRLRYRPRSWYGLAILAVAIILGLQIGATAYASVNAAREAQAATGGIFAFVGDATADRILDFVGDTEATADALAEGIEVADADARVTPAQIYDLLRLYPQVAVCSVAYADGSYTVVAATESGYESETAGPSERASIRRHNERFRTVGDVQSKQRRDRTDTVWYRSAVSRLTGLWIADDTSTLTGEEVVEYARAAYSEDGELIAVVAVKVEVADLSELLSGLPVGTDGEAFILTRDRRVVAAPQAYDGQLELLEARTGEAPLAREIGIGPAPSASPEGVFGHDDFLVLERPLDPEGRVDWILRLRATEAGLSPGLTAFQRTTTLYLTSISLLVMLGVALAIALRRPIARMRAGAATDPLTGLANRRELARRGDAMVAAAKKRGARILVATFDVDGFKAVNDAHGHTAGDDALVRLADALAESTGPRDIAARLGGDEFAVIRWLDEGDDARAIVEKIRSRAARKLASGALEGVKVGASAGYAVSGTKRPDLDALLTAADEALVAGKAKRKGRTVAAS